MANNGSAGNENSSTERGGNAPNLQHLHGAYVRVVGDKEVDARQRQVGGGERGEEQRGTREQEGRNQQEPAGTSKYQQQPAGTSRSRQEPAAAQPAAQ